MFLLVGCFVTFLINIAAEKCPDGEPVIQFDAVSGTNPSVFDDLTVDEINKVMKYIKGVEEFNVQGEDDATLDSTYIFLIERLPPGKAQVLAHLDNSGPRPERYAKVVLYRGNLTPGVIEEYQVGPLPDVAGHTRLTIVDKYDSIPYIKRHTSSPVDEYVFDEVVSREMGKVDDILKKVTGYHVNNCTDRCLTWYNAYPAELKSNTYSMLISMYRDIEGYYVQPVGMEFRIDTKGSLDPEEFVTDYIWFKGETFSSIDDMIARYTIPVNLKAPVIYEDDDSLFSSCNQRGDPLPEKKQRGPRSFMPDGRRYKVDGHHVEWQGWSFDFNLRTQVGLQVHDIRFKGERIAYELSMSEVGLIYSGASPYPMYINYLDTSYQLGAWTYSSIKGMNCPDHATFFDFAHYVLWKASLHKDSVCLYEFDRGVPIRHHWETDYESGYQFVQGMPGNVLTLRSVITLWNYEYMLDYIFHQNGAVETTLSLSGYIVASSKGGNEAPWNPYGFQVVPDGFGPIHNHLLHFKADIDVVGQANRFETLDIKMENIPDPTRPGDTLNIHRFDRNLRETEKNATYKYNFDTPRYLVFYNENEENKYGNKRGYRLFPKGYSKQLVPENWAYEKAFSYARYQVAVTKQHDVEERASSMYNTLDKIDPIVFFPDFIENDENIVDQDLVAWISLGSFHIPRSEDIPLVNTPGMSMSYFLLPFNFFNEDPSLASRDNIRINPGDDGQYEYEYVGVSPDVTCIPQNVDVKVDKPTSGGIQNGHFSFTLLLFLWFLC